MLVVVVIIILFHFFLLFISFLKWKSIVSLPSLPTLFAPFSLFLSPTHPRSIFAMSELAFCSLCKRSMPKRGHVYSKTHKDKLTKIFQKSRERLSLARRTVERPSPFQPGNGDDIDHKDKGRRPMNGGTPSSKSSSAGGNEGTQQILASSAVCSGKDETSRSDTFWCYFCEKEIPLHSTAEGRQDGLIIEYGGLVHHYSSQPHAEHVHSFFCRNCIRDEDEDIHVLSLQTLGIFKANCENNIASLDKGGKRGNLDGAIPSLFPSALVTSSPPQAQTTLAASHSIPQSSSLGNSYYVNTVPWYSMPTVQVPEASKSSKQSKAERFPNRVGSTFDRSQPFPDDWLPDFGSVWEDGPRLFTKAKFLRKMNQRESDDNQKREKKCSESPEELVRAAVSCSRSAVKEKRKLEFLFNGNDEEGINEETILRNGDSAFGKCKDKTGRGYIEGIAEELKDQDTDKHELHGVPMAREEATWKEKGESSASRSFIGPLIPPAMPSTPSPVVSLSSALPASPSLPRRLSHPSVPEPLLRRPLPDPPLSASSLNSSSLQSPYRHRAPQPPASMQLQWPMASTGTPLALPTLASALLALPPPSCSLSLQPTLPQTSFSSVPHQPLPTSITAFQHPLSPIVRSLHHWPGEETATPFPLLAPSPAAVSASISSSSPPPPPTQATPVIAPALLQKKRALMMLLKKGTAPEE